MEVIAKCNPMFLHLKLCQTEELVRIYSKNEKKTLKEESNNIISNKHIKGKKTVFNMLLTAFNELKCQVSLEKIPEEFEYTIRSQSSNLHEWNKQSYREIKRESARMIKNTLRRLKVWKSL